ncbi:hypothetical protein TELCIR_13358 [Teladorsagia circumcincta]|uniref:DUF7741 domain-containing protein n=1 Tax=Teladorsagia circumcincta TaxID=45464 RepID=A0A2G9U5L2_TELCI|nr:hypothetical protein TELCIR_13358 [Teladorsagia circumcincta]
MVTRFIEDSDFGLAMMTKTAYVSRSPDELMDLTMITYEKRGTNPHSYCGSSWEGTNEARCFKNPDEEEQCVCPQAMCNAVMPPEMAIPSGNSSMHPTNITQPASSANATKTRKCKNGMKFSPNAQAVFMGEKLTEAIRGGIGTDSKSAQCVLILAAFAAIVTALTAATRSIVIPWVLCISFILKGTELLPFTMDNHTFYREFNVYLYGAIKILNFALYLCSHKEKKYSDVWMDHLVYMTYLPYAMTLIVYIPLMKAPMPHAVFRGLAALIAVFGVVLAWHGTKTHYICWVSLSAAELIIEKIGKALWSTPQFQEMRRNIGEENTRRLIALSMLATVIPG